MKKLRATIEYFQGKNQGWLAPKWIVNTFGVLYNGNESWKIGPILVITPNSLCGDTFYQAIRRGSVWLRLDKN